jgi:hypothetical protein
MKTTTTTKSVEIMCLRRKVRQLRSHTKRLLVPDDLVLVSGEKYSETRNVLNHIDSMHWQTHLKRPAAGSDSIPFLLVLVPFRGVRMLRKSQPSLLANVNHLLDIGFQKENKYSTNMC